MTKHKLWENCTSTSKSVIGQHLQFLWSSQTVLVKIPLKDSSKIKKGRHKCGAYYRARGCSKARGRKGGTSAATQNIVSHEYIQQLKITSLIQCCWTENHRNNYVGLQMLSIWMKKAQLDIWRASLELTKSIDNSALMGQAWGGKEN